MSSRTRRVAPLNLAIVSGAVFLIGAGAHSSLPASAGAAEKAPAQRIIEATGVSGGLIVHVGCGDGKLTARLPAGDGYLVQGLDADPDHVAKAREYIQSLGLYGKVSIDCCAGQRLPYVDNLVNLIVSEDLGAIAMDEAMRVLVPGGVA